jgi:photosystem II stability/assembly factor-like uncharacterized protein
VLHARYPSLGSQYDGLTFFDPRRGILWRQDGERGTLLYTADGGQAWHPLTMPHALNTCKRRGGEIDCAGGGDFWSLRIVPAKVP